MDEENPGLGIPLDENTTKTFETIAGVTDLNDSDIVIRSNGFIQIFGALGMIVVYFICRNKTPWVYYPNIKNKPQHPCYQHNPGLFSWIFPLITTTDTQLLSVVGLDGFMLLQTIKLLYRIFFFLSLSIAPVLCMWLWALAPSPGKPQFFIRLCLFNVSNPNIYWYILAMSYVITAIVIYLVFIYYKRFVTLRQLYLASPATMTSILQMKKIANDLQDDQNAIDYVNVSSRTILIDRLPPNITNDKEFLKYMESLKIGEIENVSLIHDTYKLQKMYEERDTIIQDVEKAIAAAFVNVQAFYKKEKSRCRESFSDLYSEDLEKAVLNLFDNTNFTIDEKVRLFNNFCKYADAFFPRTFMGKTAIDFNLAKLADVNSRILQEKESLEKSVKTEEDASKARAKDTLYVDVDVKNDVSFFSASQITNFRKNADLFTLDLPVGRRKGFVTFVNQKSARILSQTRLGTRVFSSNTTPAPAPYDVLWRNICRDEVPGFFLKLASLGLYALTIITFLVLVVLIIQSLQIEQNSNNYIFKYVLKSSFLRSLYKGILAPLIYNILLFFVPIIIKTLLHTENINSFSGLQVKLMYRLSLFLFFNAFIATIVISYAVTFSKQLRPGTSAALETHITEIGHSIIKSSVFFFNTIVQRLCIGSMIVILKPVPFLYNWILAPFVIFTRRQSMERAFSPPIDFGNHIPNLLLVLPMALAYSCICPLLLIVAFVFYFFSYIVYKNELLYASRNDYESGGSYWRPCVRFIIFSLFAYQILTAIFTFSMKMNAVFYSFLPLIFFTFVISQSLHGIFEDSSENFPMNEPEEKFLDKFAKKTVEDRHKMLSEWKEIGEEVDEDILPISEVGFEDKSSPLTDSYYKDPSTLLSIGNIILPKNFFKTVHFLKSFDKNNLFGLKK